MSREAPVWPQWFVDEIATGLQRLYVLSLSGAPAAETLTATATIWCDTVGMCVPVRDGWECARDAGRLRVAFRDLCGQCERWPTPKQLIDLVPSLPPPKELPAPTRVYTDAERQHAAATLAKLEEMFRAEKEKEREQQAAADPGAQQDALP